MQNDKNNMINNKKDITNLNENNLVEVTNSPNSIREQTIDELLEKKNKKHKKEISYKNEILRKMIHLCSLSIPIIYIFVEREFALTILIPMALIAIIIDLASKKIKSLRNIYQKIFGSMLRKHEKKKKKILLNGASWVLIAAVLTVFIFPKIIAITAFSILIISDIAAALIGRKFGRTTLFNKSWEGTLAFIFSAILVVVIIGFVFSAPWSFFAFGSLAAIAGGFAEAASKILRADDNLTIPICVGFVLWGGNYLSTYFNSSFIYLL